jgi:hypothetical protein
MTAGGGRIYHRDYGAWRQTINVTARVAGRLIAA